jgi:ABC-2 type transport system ATP-binding protein
VSALIDFVAKQPEAQLDKKGDPRVGMAGGSYGGGIQLVAAGLDHRIDAIIPDIAWHSLATSLYQDDTFKAGWAGLLYLSARARGHLDPHIDSAFAAGSATGRLSAADKRWFISRGPGNALVSKIRIPTLLIQGTVDTLFPLDEAVANYTQLWRHSSAPVRMLWFCGGHGTCLTPAGDTRLIEERSIAWFKRYLDGDRTADPGPPFEWVDQEGTEHSATQYPPPGGKRLTAHGSGRLPLQAAGGSGPLAVISPSDPTAAASAVTGATKAANAVNVTVHARSKATLVVGAPRVTLRYRGTAASPDARLYGQVVDDATGLVLGNLVTPIPVVLDGKQHTVTRPLELVSATLRPGRTFTVQIAAATTAYGATSAAFNTGGVDLRDVAVSLPALNASELQAKPPARPRSRPHVVRVRRLAARRYAVTLRSTRDTLRNVRIRVETLGGRTLGTARLSRLGTKRRTVVVRLQRRAGARVRVVVTATRG